MQIFRPVKTNNITQWFGKENTMESCWPFYKELGLLGHNGIDIGCPIGTPVCWPGAVEGTVTGLSTDLTAGLGVEVRYDQDGKHYRQIFWHLSEIKCMVGDKLGSGDVMGLSGNTGKYTTGPHLHWGLKEEGLTDNGSYYTLNHDNGYFGSIDPKPFFENLYVVDVVAGLKLKISLLARLVELFKALFGLKK